MSHDQYYEDHEPAEQSLAEFLQSQNITLADFCKVLNGITIDIIDNTNEIRFSHTSPGNTFKKTLELAVKNNIPLPFMNCNNKDLSGINLRGAHMPNSTFKGANLSNTDLSNGVFVDTSFAKCNASYANFSNTQLMRTSFVSSNVSHANFTHARLEQANFTTADMTGADLTNTTRDGIKFVGAKIDGMTGTRKKKTNGERK